jgi:hypothetical protein
MNATAKIPMWCAVVILAGAPLANRAAEEFGPLDKKALPWEKGSLSVGGFVGAFDSTLSFGRTRVGGVTVNAEDLFNLDTSLAVLRIDALYRPDPGLRHQLDFSYAAYHRHGSRSLSADLSVGDVTYPLGATVDAVFNFDIIRGVYSYAVVQDDRMRISVGLGIYAIPLRYSLEGNATNGRRAVQGADTTLPLPALALRGEFQLIPKLFLYTGIEAMYIEAGDVKGSLLEADVGLEYRPWKHVGIGLGYNGMLLDVEGQTTKSAYPGGDFIGKAKVNYNGLMLYGKFTF